MAQAVFGFDEQLERVSEIDVVVVRCFRPVLSWMPCVRFIAAAAIRSLFLVRTLGSSTSAARRSGIGSLDIRGVARFIDKRAPVGTFEQFHALLMEPFQIGCQRLQFFLRQHAELRHQHARFRVFGARDPLNEALEIVRQYPGAEAQSTAHVSKIRSDQSIGGCATDGVASAATVGEK
jgi:hypothetical protein